MSDKSNLTYRLFEHVFGENREMLERLAYFYVGSREDAEDIVSQSFLNLWEKREDILEDRILPYLFTTVKNACLDYRRKESVHKQTHEQLQRQERSMMEIYTSTIESRDPVALFTDEILSIYKETLLALPPQEREVWLRNRIDGLTYKRVDKNMQKVMKKLKAALSEYLSLILFLASMGLQL